MNKFERIQKILDNHSVPYYVWRDRIYADAMSAGVPVFDEVIDVTDWTIRELYEWLGY